ncbi:hypothetical protein BU23DRAFT_569873 [Bimuria novae-zelandiae CBS 107.79]|uniref:MARVEL domain-containing protein n=1 Tax=Bimuria novae-zelandiae CBS 107.79 TaxID=1447943 RepID=A0A6A5VDP8_9PLEO|nr:hypothetical protein BU23DRAFT_569873 [Bimuria novae-zelandiae CBS 107.79]
MAYIPAGGPVSVHPYLLIPRTLQLLLALTTLATTAYPLSLYSGGPLRPPLISTLLISLLTLLILPLTTPLHITQRCIYDPRIALALDLLGTLFWLATCTALGGYLDVFSEYGEELRVVGVVFAVCGGCRSAWRSGVAACVFAGVEFALFLLTTLVFLYYYHCHLAGQPAWGLPGKGTGTAAGVGAGGGYGVEHDTAYGMSEPTRSPAATTSTAQPLRSSPSHNRGHTGLNGHSPRIDTQGPFHAVGTAPHSPASNHGKGTEASSPVSPIHHVIEMRIEPASPVSISHISRRPSSNRPTTAGTNPPYPSTPPLSPTRPGRHGEYGIESGSNVGPGADTTRL